MNISELCVRRPVFATMLLLFPVVGGIISYFRIGTDLNPNVEFPVITVSVSRPGTSVEEMESSVTKVMEDAVNTLSGIDELRSTTTEGSCALTVQFILEKNRDVALQEVQGKVSASVWRLPEGTQTPVIDKRDLDADPVMTIAISGKRALREVTEIADREIRDALSSLDGIGSVTRLGGRKRAIQVTVDAPKLEAYGVSIDQVGQALARQNLEQPGGRVDQSGHEPSLRTMGRIADPRDFSRVIIADVNGQPVRIEDVGSAADSVEEPRSIGRLDGDNAVIIEVRKQSGTNTVDVIDVVKAKLVKLAEVFKQSGRGDIRMQVIRDQSVFIVGSLHEVKKHLLIGAVLVALTILLFLHDWRTMVIASLSIPVSLLATFTVMRWMDYTLNNITLLSLVMAVGIVIDDAVVVHENIFRWMEDKGRNAWDAALGATKEITLAVASTTLSLLVIFLGMAFMQGRVGRFFHAFGVVMAVAIAMSMLVSFTLTPMLASRFLKLSPRAHVDGARGGFYGLLIERPYLYCLRWAMRHHAIVVLLTLAIAVSPYPLPFGKWLSMGDEARAAKLATLDYPGWGRYVGSDFIPIEDQSEFDINILTPPGWTLDKTSDVFAKIEDQLRAMPEVVHALATIGDSSGLSGRGQGDVTKGRIYVKLIELNDRKADAKGYVFSQMDVMKKTRAILAKWPDLRTIVQGGGSGNVEATLVGSDLDELGSIADKIIEILRGNPGLVEVATTLPLRKPEVRVIVDRDRAAEQGVAVQAVGSTLHTLVGGAIVSDYRDARLGELYDVWLRARGIDRDDPAAIERLTVPGTIAGNPALVRLGAIAHLDRAPGPTQIDRYARQRKITIVASLVDLPLSDAVAAFQRAADQVGLPAGYQFIASGRAKVQAEAYLGFLIAFGFSAMFMYMVLAAQFESFALPVSILLAMPLTIPFALLSLIILQQPMTIYSALGVFLLFGVVKKNGILQVDYTNVLRRQAAEDPAAVAEDYRDGARQPGRWGGWLARLSTAKRVRAWAIMEANRVRLRPILMTTLMLMASMVPIALGTGPGSGRRAAMAKVIVGGQAMSLLLSLLVTPVVYSLLDDVGKREKKRGSSAVPPGPIAKEQPVEPPVVPVAGSAHAAASSE